MRALDMTHRPAVTIAADATITAAAELMEHAGVGCLAVLDAGSLVGIVTDRDLVRRAIARRVPADARIDLVMSSPVVSVPADADMRTVFDVFRQHAVRRLPVVRAGQLEGIISVDDLVVTLTRQLDDIVRPVTAELLFAHHDNPLPVAVDVAAPMQAHSS
jgi:CBS domain-containing protein